MRCICLSHETALEFWRLWSARNGIALHLFHCRKTMQTDDLPFRIFPSSAVLVDSSSAKRTVVEIIDGALEDGVPEELAELSLESLIVRVVPEKFSMCSDIASPGCVLRTG